jgi:catechol 2,3-dioxygenase
MEGGLDDIATHLEAEGISYVRGTAGLPQIFCEDPAGNLIELNTGWAQEPIRQGKETEAMVKPRQLGHVNIRVRELDRSIKFYTEVLGLEVTHRREAIVFLSANNLSHELAISPLGPEAPGPDTAQVGTNHIAWQMGSFADLQQMYHHLQEHQIPILRRRQNAASMGIYFPDPDGNENEVYYEEPDARWREGGWQGTFPRQLEEVIA